ncbi:MAG TPA: hypothetical protein VGG07_06720 [Solirubrobacteraceae bacterium]
MTRGRRAALPVGPGPARPDTLIPGTLLVEHRDAAGQVAEYDFELLTCPAPMRVSFAALFAAKCSRSWRSLESSKAAWYPVTYFTQWMSVHYPDVEDVDELTSAMWKHWRMSQPTTVTGHNAVRYVALLLRADPRIDPRTREALNARLPKAKKVEQSFSPEQFAKIQSAARRTFRAAHLRITENIAILNAWRAGEIAEGGDRWLVGEALDALARTGDVPCYSSRGSRSLRVRVLHRYVQVLGGENALCTWRRLYLGRDEAIAMAALFTLEQGLNMTTISRLPVPRPSPDPGEDGFPVYRLEIDKRRRVGRRQFETRNLADFGAGSPGRLVTMALEATAPARAYLQQHAPEVDRLVAWRRSKRMDELADRDGDWYGPLFVFGVSSENGVLWAKSEGLEASPFRRGRRTANVVHRREPTQNTQDTHDSVYVLPDHQAQAAAVEVIAAGAAGALEHARTAVLSAQVRARPDPHDEPTATADCHDRLHSPFTEHGVSCAASFLMCLACPNARVHPAYHPRLAYLCRSLEALRSAMDPAWWEADWRATHERLLDLRTRLGEGVWGQALTRAGAEDREIVTSLLRGEFDQ